MTTWSTSRAANAINIPHHPLCQAHPTCTTRPWSLSRSSKRNCSSRWINNCRTYAIWRKLPEWNYAIRFDQIVILVNCTSKWLVSHKIILKVAFVGHHLDQVIGRLEASAGKYLVRENKSTLLLKCQKEKKSVKTFIKRSQLLPIKVLHFSPSVLVLKYNLVPILFPPCRDPLLQRNQRDPVKK